jgi:hypothetical protein
MLSKLMLANFKKVSPYFMTSTLFNVSIFSFSEIQNMTVVMDKFQPRGQKPGLTFQL